MFKFNFHFDPSTVTTNTNNKEDNTMNNSINFASLTDSIARLNRSIILGMTYNGDASNYKDLMDKADTISTDIISQVFATVNIASRLTGLVGLQSSVASVMQALPDTPSMEDIKTMFSTINGLFEEQYELAVLCKNEANVATLSQVCKGKSVFSYAYYGLNMLYGKVSKVVSKHLPKVEVHNAILRNVGNAFRTVGSTLYKGFKLVLKGLKLGMSLAAALVLEVGRVITHIVRSAIQWVQGKVNAIHDNTQPDEVEDMNDVDLEYMAEQEANYETTKAHFVEKLTELAEQSAYDEQTVEAQRHLMIVLAAMEEKDVMDPDKMSFEEAMFDVVQGNITIFEMSEKF